MKIRADSIWKHRDGLEEAEEKPSIKPVNKHKRD